MISAAAACVLALSGGGCAPSLPEPREPNRAVPKSFIPTPAAASGTSRTASVAQKTWSAFFRSPELRALIEAALANNRELNAQFQELVIAKAEIDARQGEYLPRLGAGVGAGVEVVGEHAKEGAIAEGVGLPDPLGDFSFGLRASWEVDIWGRLRSAAEAARYRYLASVEARHFLVTELVAELARSYFELIALDNKLDTLRRNIQVQRDALEVVKLEKQAARVTELAVQRFEAEVLKNRSRIFEVEQERVRIESRINFLVGRYPQPVKRNAAAFLEMLPSELATGLPSELLDNRPDVRRATLALEAAKLDVAAARAAFYPALSLDADVGYQAFRAEHLVATPEALVARVAGNLVAPLLNRSAIEAEYRSANARQLQAVFDYEKTLLQAFTEVANGLAGFENLRRCAEMQAQQVALLTRSVEVSKTLFLSARADYGEVLLTRRDSLEAEVELIETRRQQLQAMVDLYQALGGGWRPEAARAR